MANALLFPGQGSQAVGMGKELYRKLPKARRILDEAEEIAGFGLKRLMFEGPQKKLTDTRYAQPALFACSAMYLELAREKGMDYGFAAGHSLGEYNALLAAGVFTFVDGMKLVLKRGEVMSRQNGKGIMTAVLGSSEEEIHSVIRDLAPDVVMANLNTKSQVVISGTVKGVKEAESRLEKLSHIKLKTLSVSAAFHSPQMETAGEVMRNEIKKVTFREPSAVIVSNTTGIPVKDAAVIRENLMNQITGQVRWRDTILNLKEAGVRQFVEAGNGDVLRKMNKAIVFRPKCIGLEI